MIVVVLDESADGFDNRKRSPGGWHASTKALGESGLLLRVRLTKLLL
jgi:hypothetical protein